MDGMMGMAGWCSGRLVGGLRRKILLRQRSGGNAALCVFVAAQDEPGQYDPEGE